MTKSKAKNEPEEQKFTRKLAVKLSPREITEKKDEAFDLESQEEDKRAELSKAQQPLRDAIKELVDKRKTLRHQIREGVEERDVSCVWKKDFSAGEVWAVRIDTREEVPDTRRTMTADERQEVFPNVKGGGKKNRTPVNDLEEA
jgi:hypothetical protein